MSTQVNTFDPLDDGYTRAEWEQEQSEVEENIAEVEQPPMCFTPRSPRPRRDRGPRTATSLTGRLPWRSTESTPGADDGLPTGGWTPGIGIPAPERPADHLPEPDVILVPPSDRPVRGGEGEVREHSLRPCHKVADHRPSWETRWRTPQSLGLPWSGSEFVLVGPDDELVPGTHVEVTHKNGSTSRAYVASLGPRTTCGGRVGYTR